jgi:hypothetical protein
MNPILLVPLLAFPAACAALGYNVSAMIVQDSSRIIVAAFSGLVAFGIGLFGSGKIEREGIGSLIVPYGRFAITVAAGFFVQHLIQSETPWPAAAAFCLGLYSLYRSAAETASGGHPNIRILRGSPLADIKSLFARRFKVVNKGEPSLLWGGLPIPERSAVRHFLYVGASGSGKTTAIRMLMNQVLPTIQPTAKRRAFIYDGKGDMPKILSGMGLDCDIFNLNPYDKRGVGWNISADMTRPQDAQQLAEMLYPDGGGGSNERFFVDGARALIASIVMLFNELAPGRWTLRDIICAANLEASDMRRLFDQVPRLKHDLQNVFTARSYSEIAVSVTVTLKKYGPVAAAWDYARRQGQEICLRDWVQSNSILLLPVRDEDTATLRPISALLLRRVSDLLLSLPESRDNRTWLFLDELADLGHITKIPDLASKGRSKGVAMVVGFQALAGLRDEKRGYGKEMTDQILGQFQSRAYLAMEDPETAEWASKCLREVERIVTLKNWSPGKSVDNANQSEQLNTARVVTPSDLLGLPNCDDQNGLHAYYDSSDYQAAWKYVMPGASWRSGLEPRRKSEPEFIQRVGNFQIEPWTELDRIRLHLSSAGQKPINGQPTEGQSQTPKKTIWDLPKQQ